MLLPDRKFEEVYEQFRAECEMQYASHYRLQIRAIREGLCSGEKLRMFGDVGERFEIRDGELTLVAGPSGAGKSLLTGQFGLDFASRGINVCIMSFEMEPRYTIDRMVSQCVGRNASIDDVDSCISRFNKRLVFVNKVGSASPKLVYGAIITAAKEYDCKQIFVDNLMKVCDEFGDNAMNGQRRFIATLCELAKALGVHIWLVHHVKKTEKETDQIDKNSVRGASVITDQADNIVLLQRNIAKERKQEKFGFSAEVDNNEPDSVVSVVKQRNGDWQGSIKLWYDTERRSFCTVPARVPIKFF